MNISRRRATTLLFCIAPASCFLLAGYVPVLPAPPPETEKPAQVKKEAGDAKTIEALIVQLGDDSYETRETAHKKLAAIGEPAMKWLRKAAESPDAEVRERAEQLITAIESQYFSVVFSVRGLDREVRRIVLTPEGTRFLAAGSSGLCLGELEAGKPVVRFGNDPTNWCLAISADGKRAIAGGDNRLARVYDLESGKELQVLAGHDGQVWGAALLPDGNRALTGGKDKSLRLWDIQTGKQLAAFTGVKEDVRCLALSRDGKTVAVGHLLEPGYGTLRLWDVEKQQEIREFPGHTRPVAGVAFSPDGKKIVTASFDKTVRIWDVASGKELKRFVCTHPMECAVFADGERRVLCAGNREDPTLQLWDVAQGQRILRSAPLPQAILGVASLPGGGRAVTASRDGMIRLWRWTK